MIRPFIAIRKNQLKFFSELGVTCVFIIFTLLTQEDKDETYFLVITWTNVAILGIIAGGLAVYALFFVVMGMVIMILNLGLKLISKCRSSKIKP